MLACLAATWLIWGSTYLAIKFALAGFPPFFQMGTRFLSSYTFVNPVIAMALGALLAAEQFSRGEWLATAVIVAGVVLLMLGRRQA